MTSRTQYNAPETDTPCSAPLTRAALLALRAANSLRTDCFYEINDWVQGTTLLGPNTIQIHAVNSNTLNTAVDVLTPFDNVSWPGVYDIDLTGGTMIQLSDTKGNVVKDNDGSTVGAFPWGNVKFINNYVQDSTLTGWALFGGTLVNGFKVRNATVNLTSTPGTSTIVDSEIDGGSFAATGTGVTQLFRAVFKGATVTKTGNNNLIVTDGEILGGSLAIGATTNNQTITRSILRNTNITHTGATPLNIVDSEVSGSTFNISSGGNVWGITRSTVTGSTVTTTVGTRFNLIDSYMSGSTVTASSGPGAFQMTACTVQGSAINATGARGMVIDNMNMSNSTLNLQRTNTNNTDTISDLDLRGASTLTFSGGTDGGGSGGAVYNGIEIAGGSLVTCNAPGAANVLQIGNCRISGRSTLNLAGASARWIFGRVDTNSIVNTGNFVHVGVTIELNASTTNLTANNTGTLKSKSFDDTI